VAPRWGQAVRIIHPFPTLMNVVATGGLAVIATRGGASVASVVHLMLAMLAIQACIGTVNDLTDRELDAASKPSKPLVQGALSVKAARLASAATFAMALILSAGFGMGAWLLAMTGLGCGLVYDLRLKRTIASGAPFIVGLPLLPIWVWVSLGRFQPRLLALIPLGALIGLALHLANSVIDLDADERAGVRGLASLLGRDGALATCWASFALALIAIGVSAAVVPYRRGFLLPGLAAATFCFSGAVLACLLLPLPTSLRAGWSLLAVGSAALALGWLGALPAR